jgi:hypothetical protein
MKPTYLLVVTLGLGVGHPIYASSPAVEQLMDEYRSQGVVAPSLKEGEQMWKQQVAVKGKQRSCGNCHTNNLQSTGKHAKSKKRIEPLAPSVNPDRLQQTKKIKKWFKRNCKWTWGRECSAQEQASLLLYIDSK